MKLRLLGILMLSTLWATASATPVVSTLSSSPTSNSSYLVNNNDYAAGFMWAGTEDLDYAELYIGFVPAGRTPTNDLVVSIYNSDTTGVPGSSLFVLSGSNPTTAGIYRFNKTSGAALSAGTNYWLVASANQEDPTTKGYDWFTGSTPATGSGAYNGTMVKNSFGLWDSTTGTNPSHHEPAAFAVYAKAPAGGGGTNPTPTPTVPEPTTLALLGLGLAGIGAARRRKTV